MNRRGFLRSAICVTAAVACPVAVGSPDPSVTIDVMRNYLRTLKANNAKKAGDFYHVFVHPDAAIDLGIDTSHPNVHIIKELDINDQF